MGIPMFFIRLTGCNLRCKWCDTQYAFYEGEYKSEDELVNMANKMGYEWVCLTGGEPLLQDGVYSLLYGLMKKHKVLIETNGSILIDEVPTEDNVFISLDIKTPSSGMHKAMKFENIDYLGDGDYVKFVIADEEDYRYALKVIEDYDIHVDIIFQPVWGYDLRALAERAIKDGLNVRVLPQLHKIIWGEKRGV